MMCCVCSDQIREENYVVMHDCRGVGDNSWFYNDNGQLMGRRGYLEHYAQ